MWDELEYRNEQQCVSSVGKGVEECWEVELIGEEKPLLGSVLRENLSGDIVDSRVLS